MFLIKWPSEFIYLVWNSRVISKNHITRESIAFNAKCKYAFFLIFLSLFSHFRILYVNFSNFELSLEYYMSIVPLIKSLYPRFLRNLLCSCISSHACQLYLFCLSEMATQHYALKMELLENVTLTTAFIVIFSVLIYFNQNSYLLSYPVIKFPVLKLHLVNNIISLSNNSKEVYYADILLFIIFL